MTSPSLSVVLLTRNEEANVADAVRSLLAQDADLEIIVVDSASTDRTLQVLESLAPEAGGRMRVVANDRDIPIGEARNLGAALARAPAVAFMSADATAAPGWARAAVEALSRAELVYGRQEHAPPALSVAAVVRGLRYHHYRAADRARPDAFASNVNAAIAREVFDRVRYVDEGTSAPRGAREGDEARIAWAASALDDVLFTREARSLGYRVAYEPSMLVRHKDVSDLASEWAKARREGYGWGILSPKLGLNRPVLAWGLLLAAGLLGSLLLPPLLAWLAFLAPLYAPAARRVLLAGAPFAKRAPHLLLGALVVSPAFDVGFLFHYLRGLRERRRDLTGVVEPHGA